MKSEDLIVALTIGISIGVLASVLMLIGAAIGTARNERDCLLHGEVELGGEVYTCELKEEGREHY